MNATKKDALQREDGDEESSLLSKLSLHHIWPSKKDNATTALKHGFNTACRYPYMCGFGQRLKKARWHYHVTFEFQYEQ
jgi:hypothetical protein